jgi:hypothetical protein
MGKEREKERKKKKEKPQTSFENQFVVRAWSARQRLSRSGILKTLGATGSTWAAPRLALTLLRCPWSWA